MAELPSAPIMDDANPEKQVEEDYFPAGYESAEDFLKYVRETYQADYDYDKKNRDMALDDLKFVAGEQWDPIVEAAREGRPCVKINTLPQMIGQVIGDRRMNKTSIKLRPMRDATVEMANARAGIIRSIENYSRAERVYDNGLESQVTCGIGNWRVNLDWADDDVFDQDIFIRMIPNPLAVLWDRYAVDPTGRDATRCFVQDNIDTKTFEREWPKAKPDETLVEELGLAGLGWMDKDTVRVCEFWEMLSRPKTIALLNNGSAMDITGATDEQLMALVQQKMLFIDPRNGNPRIRETRCRYARMHLVTGTDILAGPYELPINRLPIIRVEGRVVHVGDDRYRYGMVRWAKDPVRMRNYWRSVSIEKLAMAPKAHWLAEDEAVEGYEDDYRNAHTSTDPLLKYKRGMKAPQQIDPPKIDAAVLNEANMNTQDIKDVTGIHDASLGIRSNEVSGVAIRSRQLEGDVANVMYHDNTNAAILETGDVVNQLIPVCYDTIRTLRSIDESEKERFIEVNNPNNPDSIDLSRGKYDAALETGPSFSTRRVEGAQAMMEMIKVAPDIMGLAADLITKYQDFPGAQEISERLKAAMKAKGIIGEDGEEKTELTPQLAEQIKQQALAEFMQSVQGKTLEIELRTKTAEARQAEAEAEEAEHKAELAELEIDERASMMPINLRNAAAKPDQAASRGNGSGASRRGARKPKKKAKGTPRETA